MARENKVPAYIILHDSTLEELCRRKPANLGQLKQVPGIGEKKADVYGRRFFSIAKLWRGSARRADGSERAGSGGADAAAFA